jgi:hypothetical protein
MNFEDFKKQAAKAQASHNVEEREICGINVLVRRGSLASFLLHGRIDDELAEALISYANSSAPNPSPKIDWLKYNKFWRQTIEYAMVWPRIVFDSEYVIQEGEEAVYAKDLPPDFLDQVFAIGMGRSETTRLEGGEEVPRASLENFRADGARSRVPV